MDKHEVRLSFDIAVTIQRAWEVLFYEITEWWPKDALTGSMTKKMVFEPFIGGHLYEDYGERQGLIWADVVGVRSPEMILLRGNLAPDFGGPAISYLKIQLEDHLDYCAFSLSDYILGVQAAQMAKSMTEGWSYIFKEGFKKYAEK